MVFEKQKGQILLIVILVVIVASTIGLSLASRTITSLRSSTEEAESQKALAAAEAGIERATQGNAPEFVRWLEKGSVAIGVGNSNLGNNSGYTTQFTQVQSSSFLLNGWSTTLDSKGKIASLVPNMVPKDEGTDVWFAPYDSDDGNPPVYSSWSQSMFPQYLNLYWGSGPEDCSGTAAPAPAALEVIVVTIESDVIKTYRYAYDSCAARRSGNNFRSASLGSFSQDYDGDGKTDITFNNRTPIDDLAYGIDYIILMRVIPLYKDAVVGINTCNPSDNNIGCTPLPSQGYIITSTGTSGQASRKITEFKGYPQTYLPYLSYGLFVAN